jgi:hypothetical protein
MMTSLATGYNRAYLIASAQNESLILYFKSIGLAISISVHFSSPLGHLSEVCTRPKTYA